MAGDNLQYARAIGTDEPLGNVGEIYQCFNPHTGAYKFVMRVLWGSDDPNDHFLWDIRDGADTQRLSFFYRAIDDKFVLRLNHGDAGAADIVTSLVQTFSAGDFIIGAVFWDFTNNSFGININNDVQQTDATVRTAPTTGPFLFIGQDYNNANILGVAAFYWMFEDVPYSSADYTDFYNSGNVQPFYVGPETIICPGSCLDGQAANARKIAPTVLDIVGYGKLMPDNTDPEQNKLDDGNTEEAGAWSTWGGGITSTKEAGFAYHGSQSVHSVGSLGNSGIYKNVTLSTNQDYYIVCALFRDNSTAITTILGFTDPGPISAYYWTDYITSKNSWIQMEHVFRHASVTAFSFSHTQGGPGTTDINLDYVSIVPSLLTDGGFIVGPWTSGLNDNWFSHSDDSPAYAQAGFGQADTNNHAYGTTGHGAHYCQKMTVPAVGTYHGIKQTVWNMPTGWYTVLGWVDTSADNTDFYIEVDGTVLGTLKSRAFNLDAADGWKRIGFTFYVGTQEDIEVRIFTDKSDGSTSVYFDDFGCIALVSAAPSTNIPATEAQSYETGAL